MAAIVVEDGSGVADAVSYVTVAELRTFCELRNVELPADDAELTPWLMDSADFIGAFVCKFQGQPSFPDRQSLAWPRTGVMIGEVEIASNAIPPAIKKAQMFAALAASTGVVLFPNRTDARIVKEKIGPIETEYDTSGYGADNMPSLSAVDQALGPFFVGGGCGLSWRTVRV